MVHCGVIAFALGRVCGRLGHALREDLETEKAVAPSPRDTGAMELRGAYLEGEAVSKAAYAGSTPAAPAIMGAHRGALSF
jgi:hypothetical protein